MATYPLIVAQYSIQGHATRTEHWSLVALCGSKNRARIFEVVGNPDTFLYSTKTVASFRSSRTLCGGCHVGNIFAGELDWLEDRLKAVSVRRNDPEFDCQTWVIAALRLLKEDGVVFQQINERFVRDELAKDYERWDVGDDTVEERLFTT